MRYSRRLIKDIAFAQDALWLTGNLKSELALDHVSKHETGVLMRGAVLAGLDIQLRKRCTLLAERRRKLNGTGCSRSARRIIGLQF